MFFPSYFEYFTVAISFIHGWWQRQEKKPDVFVFSFCFFSLSLLACVCFQFSPKMKHRNRFHRGQTIYSLLSHRLRSKKHVFAENVQRTLIEIQSLCCFNCWSLLLKWFTSHNFMICQKNRDEKYIRFSIWNNTQKSLPRKKTVETFFFQQ